MKRILIALLVAALVFGVIGVAMAQDDGIDIRNEPDRWRAYRVIVLRDRVDAGNIRWLEIWENRDMTTDIQQFTIYDATGIAGDRVTGVCYNALAAGDGMPIYEVDASLIPVNSRGTLWAQLQNLRTEVLLENLIEYNCRSGETDDVNGFNAQYCSAENVDISGVFNLSEDADAQAQLWTTLNGFPVRYIFEGSGEARSVVQRFEAIADENLSIQPPEDTGLLCFDDGFPKTPFTETLVQGNLVYGAFQDNTQTPEQLMRFYREELNETWSYLDSTESTLTFRRALDEETSCVADLRFAPVDTGTQFSVTLSPTFASDIPIPESIESLILSPAPVTQVLTETTPRAVADDFVAMEAEGDWSERTELRTDNDNSSFSVISDGTHQRYVMTNALGEGRVERVVGELPAICGGTFEIPE